MERLTYQTVFDEVIEWGHTLRGRKTSIKTTSKAMDKAIVADCSAQVVSIYPAIFQMTNLIVNRRELVSPQNPVDAYPQSPFAQLHTHAQMMRRALISETLCRAEYFTDLPESTAVNLNRAWQQLQQLPPPESPHLSAETIENLAQAPYYDTLMWAQVGGALGIMDTLLAPTLVTKFRHSNSRSQGYNHRAVQICDNTLMILDSLANCTPWQLHEDKSDYVKSVISACTRYHDPKDRLGLERKLTGDDRMWSGDLWDKPENSSYLEAFRNGVSPLGLK